MDEQKSMQQKWTVFLALIFTAHCVLTALSATFQSSRSFWGGHAAPQECSQPLARPSALHRLITTSWKETQRDNSNFSLKGKL